jgi:hypothetical protein
VLPQCHLLPPRRLGSLPGLPQINPHECLKHHISLSAYPLIRFWANASLSMDSFI